MSLKSRYLTNNEIRSIADETRSHIMFSEELPVAIDLILQKYLHIEVRPIPRLKELLDIEGLLYGDATILVDQVSYEENTPRLRFTLAHELGHLKLHAALVKDLKFNSIDEWVKKRLSIDETSLEWIEWQANEFAGRLLVPLLRLAEVIDNDEEIIKKTATKLSFCDEKQVIELLMTEFAKRNCKLFGVSSEVLKIRLIKEKMDLSFKRISSNDQVNQQDWP